MPVTIVTEPAAARVAAELDAWRSCAVAIAIDMVPEARLIDRAIRPLCPPGRQPHLFGSALTVRCEPPDFGAVVHALDFIGPGDVLVIDASGDLETAMIGEILGGHVRRRGGRGIVCDGALRDVATLAGWTDFAVFCRGISPRGPRSADHGAVGSAVTIGGVAIRPGDILIGDDDGLVAIAPDALRRGMAAAEEKRRLEATWQTRLEAGETVAAVFDLPAPAPA